MALNLDGTDDQIDHGDCNNLVDGAAALTFMCWIFPLVGTTRRGIMSKFTDTTTRTEFSMDISTDAELGFLASGAIFGRTAAATLVNNTLAHVAFVYNGAGAANADRCKIYKDGAEITPLTFTGTIPATLSSPSGGVIIGRAADAGSFFDATISHVKMWNAALTLAELKQEKESYHPVRTSNLILWAPYDDGTSARDYSGRGNHGTVTGAVQAAGPPISYGAAQLVL